MAKPIFTTPLNLEFMVGETFDVAIAEDVCGSICDFDTCTCLCILRHFF